MIGGKAVEQHSFHSQPHPHAQGKYTKNIMKIYIYIGKPCVSWQNQRFQVSSFPSTNPLLQNFADFNRCIDAAQNNVHGQSKKLHKQKKMVHLMLDVFFSSQTKHVKMRMFSANKTHKSESYVYVCIYIYTYSHTSFTISQDVFPSVKPQENLRLPVPQSDKATPSPIAAWPGVAESATR